MSLLKVKNFTKRFGEIVAVDNVSFEAERGEIFGLLGPNGAGKTTIIRLVSTIMAPTVGTAEVAGLDVVKHPDEVRKHIGVLTTEVGAYDRFSGRENLTYFGELYGLYGEVLEKRVGELVNLLEMKEYIDRKAGEYSTGMKQKLAIARSIIHDPEVIIFDEPTSGLDVLASQTVLNFMRRARELGKCVVFSTHQMPDAQKLCDRVAIIHQGKMIVSDTWPNIKQMTGAEDLEDAFLKLVRPMLTDNTGMRKSEDTPTNFLVKYRKLWTALGAIGFFLILLNFILREFIPNQSFPLAFLPLGIILTIVGIGLQKKSKKK